MLTLGSKTFVGGALLGAIAAFVYDKNSWDTAGIVLLAITAVGATLVALGVLAGAGATDRYAYEGGQDQRPASDPSSTLAPALAALGLGAVVVGFAMGASYVVIGLVAVAIAGLVWFSQAWRNHPNYAAKLTSRISDGVSLPFGMPVALLGVIGFVGVALSRTLLAVSATSSWIIALIAAAVIFVGALVVASRAHVSKTAMRVIGGAVIVALAAFAVYGLARGERFKNEGHGSHHVEAGATEEGQG